MTKWLEDALRQAKSLPSKYRIAPDRKVNKGEEVAGVVPEPLRSIWQLAQKFSSEAKEIHARHKREHHSNGKPTDFGPCEENARKVSWLEDQAKTMMGIFWDSLRYELGHLLEKGSGIGICEGWQVVIISEEDEGVGLSLADLIALAGGPPSGRVRPRPTFPN